MSNPHRQQPATFGTLEELERRLIEGLASPSSPLTDDDWRFIRDQVRSRLANASSDPRGVE